MRELNPGYFGALEERNAKRRKLLKNEGRLTEIACRVNRVEDAVHEYRQAVEALDAVAGSFETPWHYPLFEAAGVIKEERK